MRGTYKYHQKRGKKIIHRGITNDIRRREKEHQREHSGTHITQVGCRTTRKAALQWERRGGKK